MLKLALAMISAAFRTTPFSMSMQLCPNATMSLHSPSIFDVVSSITPIMSYIINNRLVAEKAGATMQRGRPHLSPSAMTWPLPNMGMRSWQKTAGLPQSLPKAPMVSASRRPRSRLDCASWLRFGDELELGSGVVTTTAWANEDSSDGGFGGGRRRASTGARWRCPRRGVGAP
uniref:Uncharacterized protein n=1 Tax=Oryza meridionalis TaxID=40149 RepID=A0A0E0DW83_9ORYZ